jgi:hypothetical protein
MPNKASSLRAQYGVCGEWIKGHERSAEDLSSSLFPTWRQQHRPELIRGHLRKWGLPTRD